MSDSPDSIPPAARPSDQGDEMAFTLPETFMKRGRPWRDWASAIAYGGAIIAMAVAVIPYFHFPFGDQSILDSLQTEWSASAWIDIRREMNLPMTDVDASQYGAWAEIIDANPSYVLKPETTQSCSIMISFATFAAALLLLQIAASRETRTLLGKACRLDMATTLISAEEFLTPIFRRQDSRQLLDLLPAHLAIIFTANMGIRMAWCYNAYYEPGINAVPGVRLFAFMTMTTLLIWVGPIVIASFWFPIYSAWRIRVDCRPLNAAGARKRLFRLFAELIILICKLSALGGMALIGSAVGMDAVSDKSSDWSLFPFICSTLVVGGLIVFTVMLGADALRDQRRKAIDEVYKFD